jgi:YtkA-like
MFNPIRNTAALSLFLSAALCACVTRPANLDVSLEKASVGGRYVVSLAPPAALPAINQLHSWTVSVKDTSGNPVSSAMLKVGGGMPQHGHGFPTKPRVTREVESGTYLVEGMKFSMPGWWDIAFDIEGLQGRDQVRFNTIVAPTTARREGAP